METTGISEENRESQVAGKNLYDIFRQNVEKNRSSPLVIFHGKHASYYSVLSLADSLAESLRRKCSVSKGSMVGIALPLSPQFFIAFLALQKIGAVAVPLDPGMTSFEFQNVMNIVQLKALFCSRTTNLKLGDDSRLGSVILTKIQDFLPFEKAVAQTAKGIGKSARGISRNVPLLNFNDLIYDTKGEQVQVDPVNDPAVAIISPSRRGELQAMMFTTANILSSAVAISKSLSPLKGRLRIGSMLPPFVPSSFLFSVIMPIFLGGTVTTVLERRNYYKLFFLCSLFDCDYVLMSPYDLGAILEKGLPNLAIKSLKGILCSSYLLTGRMREAVERTYGTHILEYYGIPEMLGVTHMQPYDRTKQKKGSPGLLLNGVEARILEEKTLTPVQEGYEGELYVKGPQFCHTIIPQPADSGENFLDGFFDTGDIARRDADGIFFIEDRKKEVIVSEGITVSSREIESAVARVEGISEVAVVGIPGDNGQEDIIAVVSSKDQTAGLANRILEQCRGILSRYKVPKKIEFRGELPKSMAGKILKRQIVEDHAGVQQQ